MTSKTNPAEDTETKAEDREDPEYSYPAQSSIRTVTSSTSPPSLSLQSERKDIFTRVGLIARAWQGFDCTQGIVFVRSDS